MEKKDRSVKDKRYEERHREERKAKCMIWGTSVPREKAEQINEFLKRYGYRKGNRSPSRESKRQETPSR